MREDALKRMADHVIEGLKKRNMEGYYCATKEEAADLIMGMLEPGSKITCGGSRSIGDLGLMEKINGGDYTVIDYPMHEKEIAGNPIYQNVVGADYFLMGTNAITVNGELINVDGASNRVGCLVHGPKHVIIIAGINKLVKTVEDGYNRIQTQVCPIIADMTNRKTPCGVAGFCADCHSPECMCCKIVITRHSRYTGRIKVVIVGEHVGL